MGGDDFTTAKICGEKVYKQLTELKEIVHPISNQSLTVLRRTTTDGKARRASTGNSTACSSYPIPEAPEHVDQLGDMKIFFEEPSWSLFMGSISLNGIGYTSVLECQDSFHLAGTFPPVTFVQHNHHKSPRTG